MFEYCFSQKKTSTFQCLLVFFAIVFLTLLFVVLMLNANLSHISKTLMLFGALGISFFGVFYFLNIYPPLSHFCAFLVNLVFAITLLWIRQTYDSTSSLALFLYAIAYCSLLLTLCLGGGVLIFQSLVFFYIALIYALFNFSIAFLGFLVVFVLGFYFALKNQGQWIKTLNFFNLLAFLTLIFFFKQISWIVPLWIVISAILLSHKIPSLSSNTIDKLVLISLMLLILFFEKSDVLISSILEENWIWVFALISLALLLWLEEMQFVAVFILLLISGLLIEPILIRQEEAYFYYWLLFFMVWIEFIVRWLVLGFFVLCCFVLLQYFGIEEEYSRLGLFLTLSCVAFFTTTIVRSKNAI